ncbi:MAG: sulfatase [Acidobacteria bacterium]|nr:sulfatase [Acidobacteriota bacterium]
MILYDIACDMQRRAFLAGITGGALWAQARRPNILFITADDLGLLLNCYGERRIRTPQLDKLAASGVRFETAYVAQASCSPSRSAMFTGLYPHSNGQYGLANTGFMLHENLRDKTIPALLKEHGGYRTGILGKLHVEPEKSFPWDMRDTDNAATRRVKAVAPKAEEFMRSAGDAPFFLMVNYSDPHAFRDAEKPGGWFFPAQVDGLPEKPVAPSKETLFDFQQVDAEAERERTANYLNAVARLDTGVGLLLEALERTGKAGNTVVVFCGDHGPPFARGKTTVYESGLRIPFLLRWPGVTKAGQVSTKFVSTVDILPTILDAAGVRSPVAMHGESLRKAVNGGKWREYLAAEFHCHGSRPFYPRRAIRDKRYKLIQNVLAGKAKPSTGIDGDFAYAISREARYEGTATRKAFDTFAEPPEFELYDLEKDPVEFVNLAGKAELAVVEKRMKDALLRWRKESNDPFLDWAFLEKIAKQGR